MKLRFHFRLVAMLLWMLPISMSANDELACPDYDFGRRYPPLRNQNGHDNCWAFVAGALFEEEQCLRTGNCGVPLSPLDASRCSWEIGKPEEAGHLITTGLDCVLKNGGICPERYAPYHELLGSSCKLWDLLWVGERCTHEKLGAIFTHWKKVRSSCSSTFDSFVEIRKNLDSHSESVDWLTGRFHLDQADVVEALNTSKDESDFLKKVMISKSCVRNRVQPAANLSVFSVNTQRLAGAGPEKTLSVLKRAFRSGRSVGVAVDLGKIWSLAPSPTPHALVINGMRFNREKKRCELQLRNSWGSAAPLNGWYDAKQILPAIEDVSFLADLSNPELKDLNPAPQSSDRLLNLRRLVSP